MLSPQIIGRRLRAARILAGLEQDQLAEALQIRGLGRRNISAVENGERELKPQERDAICALLGLDRRWFEVEEIADLPLGSRDLDRAAEVVAQAALEIARKTFRDR